MVCASVLLRLALLAALSSAPDKGPEFSDPQARAHFEAAAGHFAAEDFAAASEELRLAFELEAVAELLYARAQAERRLEHWALAADLYSQYLATDPPRGQADNARPPLLFCRAKADQAAGDCEAARAKLASYLELYPDGFDAGAAREALAGCEPPAPPEPAAPEPEPVAPTPAPVPRPVPPRDAAPARAWHRDPAGGALVGIGLGLAAAGTTVALLARATFIAGRDAPSHAEAVDAMDRGIVMERVGLGIGVAGGVVALAGVARWIAVGVGPRRSRRTAFAPGRVTFRF